MITNYFTADRPGKPYKGIAMEGMIARWYARNGARFSEQNVRVAKIKDTLPAGGNVLEVAPGPGYLSIELAKSDKYRVTALEISRTFIEIAQKNAKQANVQVQFRHGNASQLPFQEQSFDFIICVAAFKNFSQPAQAIREMYRVLKTGGRACIVDLRRDVPLDQIDKHIKNDLHMRGLNAFFTKTVFKSFLLKNAYSKAEIEGLVSQTNFAKARILEDALGMDIWLEK